MRKGIKIYVCDAVGVTVDNIVKKLTILGHGVVRPMDIGYGILGPEEFKVEQFNVIRSCDGICYPDDDLFYEWEHSIANAFRVPMVTERDIDRDIIRSVIKGYDEKKQIIENAGLMMSIVDEQEVSQEDYVIEECSELIKEMTKRLRLKGDAEHIMEETCDIFTSILPILLESGQIKDLTGNDIWRRILEKQERFLKRYEESGEI